MKFGQQIFKFLLSSPFTLKHMFEKIKNKKVAQNKCWQMLLSGDAPRQSIWEMHLVDWWGESEIANFHQNWIWSLGFAWAELGNILSPTHQKVCIVYIQTRLLFKIIYKQHQNISHKLVRNYILLNTYYILWVHLITWGYHMAVTLKLS